MRRGAVWVFSRFHCFWLVGYHYQYSFSVSLSFFLFLFLSHSFLFFSFLSHFSTFLFLTLNLASWTQLASESDPKKTLSRPATPSSHLTCTFATSPPRDRIDYVYIGLGIATRICTRILFLLLLDFIGVIYFLCLLSYPLLSLSSQRYPSPPPPPTPNFFEMVLNLGRFCTTSIDFRLLPHFPFHLISSSYLRCIPCPVSRCLITLCVFFCYPLALPLIRFM
jgi:hypothetical protein